MNGTQESRQLQKTAQAANHLTGTRKEPEKLTQKRVRELFDYDTETGLLMWKVNRRRVKVGDVIKTVNSAGYTTLEIESKSYLAHRIIWLWNYGYFPENDVDHINRVRADNRICNLREVSQSCNIHNSCVSTRNISGVKGVSVDKHGCHASIMIGGKQIHIKTVHDFAEAVAHRLAAEQCLGYNSCDNQSSAFVYMQNYIKEGGI